MTDGTHTWTLTQAGATDDLGFPCYVFGSASVFLYISGCGASFDPSDTVAVFSAGFTSLKELPSTTGMWTTTQEPGNELGYSGTTQIASLGGTMTLTISEATTAPVPEPEAWSEIAMVFFASVGYQLRKRSAHRS